MADLPRWKGFRFARLCGWLPVTVVRNPGFTIQDFCTANFDFINQYRPLTNVVWRPIAGSGRGFSFIGHHEVMIPLLAASILTA
jgi:hypothetical protein